MLTRLWVRNFKRLEDVEIELGKSVVFVGPNNSGKTSALQALALWSIGLNTWKAKHGNGPIPAKRPGAAINRRDLTSVPVPAANLLWRGVQTHRSLAAGGKTTPQPVPIEIGVEGVTRDVPWSCGLRFTYNNEESFYCRPLPPRGASGADGPPGIPPQADTIRVALLPPMSGLTATEPKWEPGRINVLLGEGQTAQVLRNLCYQVHQEQELGNGTQWSTLVAHLERLFGVQLLPPTFIVERGEIAMQYREGNVTRPLDLSSSGRGLQQTLLLLAYLYSNPGTVMLLDEPDAHLEIIRQREIYHIINSVAGEEGSQLIAASHSEVVLNEAGDRDVVVAFVGRPHRIDDRGSQVLKSLRDIGFEHYYNAEECGWVLYLEGATDLAILRTFAEMLEHPAREALGRPFVHYVANQPKKAEEHFYGLREAKPDLQGIALFDRLTSPPDHTGALIEVTWSRCEIENYFCMREVLMRYAEGDAADDLFGLEESRLRTQAMGDAISEVEDALRTLNRPSPWSPDLKVSDDFFAPVFCKYFQTLRLPNLLQKTDYHVLARLLRSDEISDEVIEKLNLVQGVWESRRRRVE